MEIRKDEFLQEKQEGDGRKKKTDFGKTTDRSRVREMQKMVDLNETQFKCGECNNRIQETGRPREEEKRRDWEMLRSMIKELRAQITEERTERTQVEHRMTEKLEDERTQRVAGETRLMEVLNTKIKKGRNTRDDADSPRNVLLAADRRRDDENGPPQWCGEEVKTRRERGTKMAHAKRKTTRHESHPTGAK